MTKKKRPIKKYDVLVSRDRRRWGLEIQVLVRHRDGTCTVKNDLGKTYRVKTSRLNGHGHWRLIGNPGKALTLVRSYFVPVTAR